MSDREPSALATRVYDETLRQFGAPDHSYRFETPDAARSSMPDGVDVFAWDPSDEVDITNLATVGMCDHPMHGAAHRAELHHAVRGTLEREARDRAATLLANLAAFPFLETRALDWWHTISRFGPFPGFSRCTAVLLHPAFTHGGWDRVEHDGLTVRILNVVPITRDEMATARADGVGALMERVYRDEIDLLRDRG